jgi:hypothetical protein
MTNSEAVKLMAGTLNDRRVLLDYLLDKIANGQALGQEELCWLKFVQENTGDEL